MSNAQDGRKQRAAKIARYALNGSQPGAGRSVERHIRRVETISALIEQRFGALPPRWKAKYCRWALEVGLSDLSPAARYDYWRSVRAYLVATERNHWLPLLHGRWETPTGEPLRGGRAGRPPKLAGRGRRTNQPNSPR